MQSTSDAYRRFRATVLKNPNGSPGLLIVGGMQKTFRLEGAWKLETLPNPGMSVDVWLDPEGKVIEIDAPDKEDVARERAEEIARKVWAFNAFACALVNRATGAAISRMGSAAFGLTILLWLSWFLPPALGIPSNHGGVAQWRVFTFYEAVSADLSTAGDWGIFHSGKGAGSMVSWIALLSPLLTIVAGRSRARWLFAMPALLVVGEYCDLCWSLSKATEAWARTPESVRLAWSPPEIQYGAFLVAGTSLLLGLCVGCKGERK